MAAPIAVSLQPACQIARGLLPESRGEAVEFKWKKESTRRRDERILTDKMAKNPNALLILTKWRKRAAGRLL
jgi:hypothetical protein